MGSDGQPPADGWLSNLPGTAVKTAVRNGMPADSVALYARWWQLESWLRELAYVELRAMHGQGWANVVKVAAGRQTVDASFTHMLGADSENPLAYLDYSQVIALIEDHWEQFEYALITRKAWDGRQEELKRIRHRIGHMRRPHVDDVARLEQTLRDLERGAFVALASYNRTEVPDRDVMSDAVSLGWVAGEHDDARRLVEHARRQYDTKIWVRSSRRPWASWPANTRQVPGLLWRVDFFVSDRWIDLSRLWYDTALESPKALLVHTMLDGPHHVAFTFSGADDGAEVADAIGNVFDAVLLSASYGPPLDDEAALQDLHDVDFRLLIGSRWQIIDETTVPVSLFGAGAKVHAAPRW